MSAITTPKPAVEEITEREEALALYSELGAEARAAIAKRILAEYSPDAIMAKMAQIKREKTGESENPFLSRLTPASEVKPSSGDELIYFGMYRGCVTLVPAQTGAGKSTLFYRISRALSGGEAELFGIPIARIYRGIYIDPENNGFIRHKKIIEIGAESVEDLLFDSGRDVNLKDDRWVDWLIEACHHYSIDYVILDPRVNLFDTSDENNNDEGRREFLQLIRLAEDACVSVVVPDHTGANEDKWMGRGATSRAGAAHVVMHMTIKEEDSNRNDDYDPDNPRQCQDRIRIRIRKDRPGKIGAASLYLQKAGNGQFIRISPEEYHGGDDNGGRESAVDRAKSAMLQLMRDFDVSQGPLAKSTLIAALNEAGHARGSVYNAFAALKEERRIEEFSREGGKKLEFVRLLNGE